jgi:hypothetical protein
MHKQTRLHGVIDAATAALDGGLATLQGVHTAIARKPFAPLRLAPGVAEVSEVVRVIHDGITSLVYRGLHTAIAVAGGAARRAARVAAKGDEDLRPGSPADLAIAALNGFAGDRLAHTGNPLATIMGLRHRGRNVALERGALAATFRKASPRLAVFVHGLACNESLWRLHAERHYGNRHTTYGSRLQTDLGYTPLYVRYNSGLHVSDNGRQLAQLLDRVVTAWPVPVDELAVVGHSMGGLVSRSGCLYAQEAAHDWVRLVRHVVFLGSPHLGAPLEKAANVAAWLLGRSDITRPFADALNARSLGVKDLRFGSLRDEDWQGVDLDALLVNHTGQVPLLEGAAHYFVAATVTRDPRHPLGVAIGDLLVREASAYGRGRVRRTQFSLNNGRHFGPMHHFDLLNHPDVYEQMRRWLAGRAG